VLETPISVTPHLYDDLVVGLAEIRELDVAVTAMARALEPDAIPVPDAVAMWETLDAVERKVNAAKTLLARRVDDSKAWKRAGLRSAAGFIAARSGSSVGTARVQLDVSRKVQQLPRTEAALRDGALSAPQAAEVVDGATADPAAEARLIDLAQRVSLKELHDEVLRLRAAADPEPETTHRRIHQQRFLRTWTDREGGWNLAARGTVGAGWKIEAALRPLIDEQPRRARAQRRWQPRKAFAFDALVQLSLRHTCGKRRTGPTHLTMIRVDLEALRRGEAHHDEHCEITGIGPIPATTARDLLRGSILKLVITKGVDLLNVTHLGRGPTAAQRIALLWAQPGCSVEGAGKRPMVPPDDARHPQYRLRRRCRIPPSRARAYVRAGESRYITC
jgi:hypothetical protein